MKVRYISSGNNQIADTIRGDPTAVDKLHRGVSVFIENYVIRRVGRFIYVDEHSDCKIAQRTIFSIDVLRLRSAL